MAYMNQEKKATINAELKKVFPKGWRYTLRVRHHSALVLTLREYPVPASELLAPEVFEHTQEYGYDEVNINTYNPNRYFAPEYHELIGNVIKAMNTGNYDNSNVMTDYFDVGHYIDFHVVV